MPSNGIRQPTMLGNNRHAPARQPLECDDPEWLFKSRRDYVHPVPRQLPCKRLTLHASKKADLLRQSRSNNLSLKARPIRTVPNNRQTRPQPLPCELS